MRNGAALAAAGAALLLAGCVHWPGIDNHKRRVQDLAVGHQDLAAGAAVPARTVTLGWDYAAGPFAFRVYALTNADQDWRTGQLAAVTSERTATVPADQAAGFFVVTAVNTNSGLESLPATR